MTQCVRVCDFVCYYQNNKFTSLVSIIGMFQHHRWLTEHKVRTDTFKKYCLGEDRLCSELIMHSKDVLSCNRHTNTQSLKHFFDSTISLLKNTIALKRFLIHSLIRHDNAVSITTKSSLYVNQPHDFNSWDISKLKNTNTAMKRPVLNTFTKIE